MKTNILSLALPHLFFIFLYYYCSCSFSLLGFSSYTLLSIVFLCIFISCDFCLCPQILFGLFLCTFISFFFSSIYVELFYILATLHFLWSGCRKKTRSKYMCQWTLTFYYIRDKRSQNWQLIANKIMRLWIKM